MRAEPSLRELYDALAGIGAGERQAFYDAHGVDATLRARLERMLEADAAPGGAVPRLGAAEIADALADEEGGEAPGPGGRVASFELVALIGEGGSSTVFRAARTMDGVEQHVALKLLRRGVFTPDARRLFRRERLALAHLQHPGIARLIEGGVTETGLAYIALELVEGVPITDFARERGLALRDRLTLFLQVCRAVDAAHRALIVHRDLKPSNVLVTADGTVKLVDFGIAKLLDTDDDVQTRMPAFTPAYAAPEQRAGGAVTTATDVFSLGVLLGELLTGRRLNDGSGRTPSGRSGDEPAPASIARRELRGDLDNIVMKAIATEPERRYASASAFADDIERLLDARPVAAHPPSRWYRTRKFVERHRGAVATTALLALALLAVLGTTLWQVNVVRQEAARANAVRDFLLSVFKSAETTLPKDTRPSVEDLVEAATARLEAQTSLPDAQRVDLLLALAKVAESVGAFEQALDLVGRSLPAVERLRAGDDTPWWDATVTRADILSQMTRTAEVVALLEPLRDALAKRHDVIGVEGLTTLGDGLLHVGRVDEGLDLLRHARERAAAGGDAFADIVLPVSIVEANGLLDAQRFREGLARAEATLALWRRQGEPTNSNLINLEGAIALGAEATGDLARAETAYKAAIALGDRFFDKPNPDIAWSVGIYGTFLIAQGRYDEAEPYAKRGLEMRRTLLGESDPRTLYAVAGMGKLRHGQHRYDDAARWYGEGIDTCRRLDIHHQVCARLLALRARSHAEAGRFADAERDIDEAERQERAFNGDVDPGFAYILGNRVAVDVKEHKYAEAVATADRELAIYRGYGGSMLQSELWQRFERAIALFELGRNDEALAEVTDIAPKYAALFPRGDLRAAILALEARALDRANRTDEARRAASEALAVDRGIGHLEPAVARDVQRIAATGSEGSAR
ncbi:MAG TPA: protein kinase [Rhodanobacteraceae bacterium]|nr:protein kinase [Rhodanobacteraceae bacterium]